MKKPTLSPVQDLIRRLTPGALFLLFLTGSLIFWAQQLAGLFRMAEVGYGDSYILYDVLHFHRTGVIYRDLSQPPYLPAQYSPLVYMIYSFPARSPSENPFFGPRLIALGGFLLCVVVVVSMVRVLIPVRGVWLWGALLATSINTMALWPLQLRGDFFGIFFSLLAIRLLLSRSRYAVLLAGLCSGLALQFKITFVASLIAGCLWLAARKRWRALPIFLVAAAITSAGLHLLFWLREPRMIAQMLTLRVPIRDISGCLKQLMLALTEPVAFLSLAAIPAVLLRPGPRWKLLLLFVLTSLAFAALTDVQAGGNINYFFEALFAMTVLAVWGALRLCAWSRRNEGLALFLTGLTLFYFVWGTGRDIYGSAPESVPRQCSRKTTNSVMSRPCCGGSISFRRSHEWLCSIRSRRSWSLLCCPICSEWADSTRRPFSKEFARKNSISSSPPTLPVLGEACPGWRPISSAPSLPHTSHTAQCSTACCTYHVIALWIPCRVPAGAKPAAFQR